MARTEECDEWYAGGLRFECTMCGSCCTGAPGFVSFTPDEARNIAEHLGISVEYARLDSQCKYAVVARGQADAYLRMPTRKDYVEKIWDHAAGSLIAQEAGAVVSDVSGRPLDFAHGRRLETNKGIVCAAAGLHQSLVDVIAQLGIAAPAG